MSRRRPSTSLSRSSDGARRTCAAGRRSRCAALDRLAADADEIVCLDRPDPFGAVGYFYGDFTQVSDQEVVDLLDRAHAEAGPDVP